MTANEMHTHHRGEAIYTAEVDTHFPQVSNIHSSLRPPY